MKTEIYATALALAVIEGSNAFAPVQQQAASSASSNSALFSQNDRREFVSKAAALALGGIILPPSAANAVDAEEFLKTGMVSMPMGVSGQAGKAKPRTGVVLREGSDVSRDDRSGSVLAEIVLKTGKSSDLTPVLAMAPF